MPQVQGEGSHTRALAAPEPRLRAAVAAARLVQSATRALGRGGGSTFPGTVGQRIAPDSLSRLAARLPRGAILVAGTNGKTTTSRMLASILRRAGCQPLHNRQGANLLSGVTATVLTNTALSGQPFGDIGLFEVDEASVPAVTRAVRPRVALLLNLFRDQLDRYGELDHLATLWAASLFGEGGAETVVLNADDPGLAALGERAPGRVRWYGLDDASTGSGVLTHAADAIYCICGSQLAYDAVHFGHLGHWRCPACGRRRPTPDVRATAVRPRGMAGSTFTLEWAGGRLDADVPLPGLYNVVNALAAAAAALTVGAPPEAIAEGLRVTSAAFGRLERVQADGREIILWLVKNPAGCNEALRTLLQQPGPKTLVIAINDRTADGHDVSWLWDADFEALAEPSAVDHIVCAGTRAYDMAVRLKYAGFPGARQSVRVAPLAAVEHALTLAAPGAPLYIFPTYTALLELRDQFRKRGWVAPAWRD